LESFPNGYLGKVDGSNPGISKKFQMENKFKKKQKNRISFKYQVKNGQVFQQTTKNEKYFYKRADYRGQKLKTKKLPTTGRSRAKISKNLLTTGRSQNIGP
jgi:hypothetical protein